ncbi:nuclear transport factor 2 family protein [Mangrovicoccus sp. HB161399]|uniref:nuclear transport factor 2 family protein n=1 Tax=Mangrovicoccus sp. HB161399 TaxID=2720392 RepID=UPI0015578415|nr:nuclear transport factor 2 family protein [Mangrovicoccus sp. HB161399]
METGAAAQIITIEMVRTYLDRLAASVMERDFDTFSGMYELPFVIHTRLHRYERRTLEELRASFDLWQRTIVVNQVTAVVLRPRRIESFGPDMLMVDYDADLLNGAQKMLPTFGNVVLMRRRGGIWRMEQAMTGTENDSDSLFLRVDPENPQPQTETYILDQRPKKD